MKVSREQYGEPSGWPGTGVAAAPIIKAANRVKSTAKEGACILIEEAEVTGECLEAIARRPFIVLFEAVALRIQNRLVDADLRL